MHEKRLFFFLTPSLLLPSSFLLLPPLSFWAGMAPPASCLKTEISVRATNYHLIQLVSLKNSFDGIYNWVFV